MSDSPGFWATRTVSDAPFCFEVDPCVATMNEGLKGRPPHPDTENGAESAAVVPESDVAVPLKLKVPQFVGLTVKPGRSSVIVTDRMSSGIPSRIDGNGPDTAVIEPLLLTCSHTGTTTFPRS